MLTEPLREAITALSEGEAPPLSLRAMLEHLASDTCRGNRHEAYLGNCPVCVSRLQRLEGALAEGETSGALEIAPGVFRATTSSSIFTEGRAAPPSAEGEGEPAQTYAWVEGLRASLREAHGRANAAETRVQTVEVALQGLAAEMLSNVSSARLTETHVALNKIQSWAKALEALVRTPA